MSILRLTEDPAWILLQQRMDQRSRSLRRRIYGGSWDGKDFTLGRMVGELKALEELRDLRETVEKSLKEET